MELKVTRYEPAGHIATITLDRPERMNTWTGRMHTEYRWCIAQAESDPQIRVILITGVVENPGYGVRPEFDHNFAFHFGLTKPVIAAINGPAAGVGLVLPCFADIRIAAAGAKLTTAHGKLGLPAEYGLSWLLPRLIGLTRANDLLLSSRVVLAEEAAQMGLVN